MKNQNATMIKVLQKWVISFKENRTTIQDNFLKIRVLSRDAVSPISKYTSTNF